MASVHLPQPPYRVLKMPVVSWRICSRPIYCGICDLTVEAIGSTPQEAEKRAVDVYADHCKQFHGEVMRVHAES